MCLFHRDSIIQPVEEIYVLKIGMIYQDGDNKGWKKMSLFPGQKKKSQHSTEIVLFDLLLRANNQRKALACEFSSVSLNAP